jgi:hypothetical protein
MQNAGIKDQNSGIAFGGAVWEKSAQRTPQFCTWHFDL